MSEFFKPTHTYVPFVSYDKFLCQNPRGCYAQGVEPCFHCKIGEPALQCMRSLSCQEIPNRDSQNFCVRCIEKKYFMASIECRLRVLLHFDEMEKIVKEGVERFEQENIDWVDKRLLEESVERVLKDQICEFGKLARLYNATTQPQ